MLRFAKPHFRSSCHKSSALFLAGLISLNTVAASQTAWANDFTNPNDFSWGAIAERQRAAMQQQMQEQEERRTPEQSNAPHGDGATGRPGLSLGELAAIAGAAALACALAGCFDAPKRPDPSIGAAPEPSPPAPAQPQIAAPPPALTYRVVRVPRHDVLNMRHLPAGDIIGAIPPDGRGVTIERNCAVDAAKRTWCIAGYGGQRGWVATEYLRQE